MGKRETDVDCMKYRKSTHLAGVDVETIISEKGNCIVTIKESFYEIGADVSGNKTDAYFIEFVEPLKGMVVNSGNRKIISDMVRVNKVLSTTDSRNIKNWSGTVIELYFDPTVKMMGQIVGGIKIKPQSPIPNISDENAVKILHSSTTLGELQTNWSKLSKQEQALPTVTALKDTLKEKLA